MVTGYFRMSLCVSDDFVLLGYVKLKLLFLVPMVEVGHA